MPGAAIGVVRDGAITTAYYGVADISTGEPITTESLFSVGSLTKSMVATVIARLAEAGRLSLDEVAAVHLPELRDNGWAQSATLRDLLANRSGLPLRADLEFGFTGRGNDDDGGLPGLVADVAAATPTTQIWSYTNVGWCLLGRVIEVVTDEPWADAMSRHLAGAGMHQTSFGHVDAERRVSGHEVTKEGTTPTGPWVAPAYGPAGTTAVSTVTDLLRFAQMHLEEPALADLRTVHANVPIYGWLDSWCLGWARFDWDGGPVWGWDGVINGERSVLRLVPDRRAAVALLTNGSTGRAMYRSLFGDLMASLFGINVPPLDLDPSPGAAGDLARFNGVYAWPDRRMEVEASGSGLLISDQNGQRQALPLNERVFLMDAKDPDEPTVTFGAYDDAGRPQVLYDMLWGLPRFDA